VATYQPQTYPPQGNMSAPQPMAFPQQPEPQISKRRTAIFKSGPAARTGGTDTGIAAITFLP